MMSKELHSCPDLKISDQTITIISVVSFRGHVIFSFPRTAISNFKIDD